MKKAMEQINILLFEDNLLLEAGIKSMLQTQAQFRVLANIGMNDGSMPLKEVKQAPEIVLLNPFVDKAMRMELMSALKENIPAARIIAMDVVANILDILEFVQAGGHGLILKNAPPEDWFSTIRAVASGLVVLPPSLTQHLFAQIMTLPDASSTALKGDTFQLTARERQVVNLIADGLSNKDIAETLHIATYTVKSHVHNILDKLQLNSRLQIAAYVRMETD
jgi:two-component system, NarL family, nitrate/nitrite response regulator NarL